MSDDVDITHGGAIAVDTDALRDIGMRLGAIAERFGDAAAAIRRAHQIIVDTPGFSSRVDTVALWASSNRANALELQCTEASTGTALMSDAFELVELRAQLEAMTLAEQAAATSLQDRIDELEASDERVSEMADWLIGKYELRRYQALDAQFDLSGVLSPVGIAPLFTGAALLGTLGGRGVLAPGTKLGGTADPVAVRPIFTSSPVAPPASLADAFRRFPEKEGAQLKVERYTMADGSNRFVLYAKGTQSPFYGGSNPLDMKSNLELYTNQQSASYQATLEALETAGAQPGDRLDIYAHSQAGMIAAHLAMESEFDVQVTVTAGSPVEPTLRDDQLLIQLRHTDDVVAALAGGGSPAGTGSPDSFVAQRVGDPARGIQDLMLEPHQLETYVETAEMVDDSGDVRLHAIEVSWAELANAVEIESTEYQADRTG